ncbi:solute carrier family 2, facilitated glucose transporter member 8-like [Dysidea avara]|uniref:solute carrier family 2, facilitated glucose transporter member 8-like n=1 Tax=Dysidea avara TaxID=196820 RepID=UPI0033332143
MSGVEDTDVDQDRELLLPEKRPYGTVQSSSIDNNTKPRLWTVAYSCAVIVQSWLVFGLTIGYTSPVLSDLEGDDGSSSAPLGKTTYQDLFSVLFPVGGLIGTIIAGWIVDKIGRKLSFLVCSITYAVGWLLIILTLLTNGTVFRLLIFAGRLIGGIGVGFASLCAPLYIAELSSSKTRGFFGTLTHLHLTTGVFIAQIVGAYITYYWLAVITLVIICLFTMLAISLKETPRWLMTQRRNGEAREVLVWLRGEHYNVDKELLDVTKQLESENKNKLSFAETVKAFRSKAVYYPVILGVVLMFFQQCFGIAGIIFNAEDIFKQAKIKSPGLLSSVTVGGTQMIFSLVGVLLTDIAGRRILLVLSSIIGCMSLTAMGTYEYLNDEPYCNPSSGTGCKENLYPMAITSMACLLAGFSVGLGAIPWLIASEIVPLKVRGLGVGIITCFNWSYVIILTGLFRNYEDAVHPWGAFWSFALVAFCGIIYIAVFIPETKGKSLEEIEQNFCN